MGTRHLLHPSRLRAVVAVLVTVAALGGCSGGSDDADDASGSASSASPITSVPERTETVPAPGGGSIDDVETPRAQETASPVALDAASETADGVEVRLASLKAIQAEASGPGEIAGPAVQVTVEIENTTNKAVDLSSSTVALLGADKAPGMSMTSEPAAPFSGSLKAGATAKGVYVFTVAKKNRSPITVLVTSTPSAQTARFTGDAA